jgi:hypothetical protein
LLCLKDLLASEEGRVESLKLKFAHRVKLSFGSHHRRSAPTRPEFNKRELVISNIRTSKLYICLFLFATAWQCYAQQSPAPATPATPAPPPAQAPAPATPAPTATETVIPPPPPSSVPAQSPYDSSDGAFSLELFYWRTYIYPDLRSGHANLNTYPSTLDYPSNMPQTPGAELSIPAGKYNTVQVSYFRTQSFGSTPVNNDITVFGADYVPGNFLITRFLLQNLNITWNYLTWPWPPRDNRFLFKTLYGLQYTNISTAISAPYLPTSDNEGNAITTSVVGSHRIIYPTLGVGLEYFLSKHLRLEMSASGFAFPRRAVTWNGDGFFAYRRGHFEVLAGGKAYHFKTSPKGVEDFIATPYGAYVGLRFYPVR